MQSPSQDYKKLKEESSSYTSLQSFPPEQLQIDTPKTTQYDLGKIKTPLNLPSGVLLVIYSIISVLTGGMIFGWPFLGKIYQESGFYSWLCTPNENDPLSLYDNRGLCGYQKAAIEFLYTVGVVTGFMMTIFFGMIFSKFGPKITGTISGLMLCSSCFFLSVSSQEVQLYIPAMMLMGLLVEVQSLCVVTIRPLFPKREGLVIGIIMACLDLSWSVPSVFYWIFTAFESVTVQNIFFVFGLCVAVPCTITLFLTLPWTIYSNNQIHQHNSNNGSIEEDDYSTYKATSVENHNTMKSVCTEDSYVLLNSNKNKDVDGSNISQDLSFPHCNTTQISSPTNMQHLLSSDDYKNYNNINNNNNNNIFTRSPYIPSTPPFTTTLQILASPPSTPAAASITTGTGTTKTNHNNRNKQNNNNNKITNEKCQKCEEEEENEEKNTNFNQTVPPLLSLPPSSSSSLLNDNQHTKIQQHHTHIDTHTQPQQQHNNTYNNFFNKIKNNILSYIDKQTINNLFQFDFLTFSIYFAWTNLRNVFFINSTHELIGPNAEIILGIVIPLSFIPTLLSGPLLDYFGMGFSKLINNVLGSMVYVFALLSYLFDSEIFAYLAVFFYIAQNWNFTLLYGIIAHKYGNTKDYGILVGFASMASGTVAIFSKYLYELVLIGPYMSYILIVFNVVNICFAILFSPLFPRLYDGKHSSHTSK